MRKLSLLLVALASAACARPEPSDPIAPGAGERIDCETTTYPDGVVEPMALGEVIAPYRWASATLRATGAAVSLDLADVPCALDDDIDWSPFDVLLFVSIPAW